MTDDSLPVITKVTVHLTKYDDEGNIIEVIEREIDVSQPVSEVDQPE